MSVWGLPFFFNVVWLLFFYFLFLFFVNRPHPRVVALDRTARLTPDIDLFPLSSGCARGLDLESVVQSLFWCVQMEVSVSSNALRRKTAQ